MKKIALRTVLLVRELEPSLFEPGVYFNIKCIGKLPGPTNEFDGSLVFETGEFERPKFDCIMFHHSRLPSVDRVVSVSWSIMLHPSRLSYVDMTGCKPMYHVTSQQTALCRYARKLMHHACKV